MASESLYPPLEDEECASGTLSIPPRPPKVPSSINQSVEENAPLIIHSEVVTQEITETTDKKGLIMSMVILLLSIPALIGAWCWPALVIGLISGTVTAAARVLGHYISFGVTATMMIGVNSYILYCCMTKRRKQPFCKKYDHWSWPSLLLYSSWQILPDICYKTSIFGNLDLGLEVQNTDRIAQLKRWSVCLFLVCSLLWSRHTQVSSCYSLELCGMQILSPNWNRSNGNGMNSVYALDQRRCNGEILPQMRNHYFLMKF